MQWAVKRSIPMLKRGACYGLSGRVSDAFWSVAGVDNGSGGPHGVVGSPAPCLPRSATLPCWSHKGVLVPAMVVPPPSPPVPFPTTSRLTPGKLTLKAPGRACAHASKAPTLVVGSSENFASTPPYAIASCAGQDRGSKLLTR